MESKNILIAVVCLINIIIITMKFFFSKRANIGETRIYGYLLLAMIMEQVAGILLFLVMNYSQEIINFFNGLYLATMAFWAMLFSLYMIRISELNDKKYARIKNVFIVLTLITTICSFLLPRSISISDNNEFYATGAAIMSVYIFSGICLSVVCYYLIKNIKKIFDKRYLPILVLLLSGVLLMVIQSIAPELFLFTPVESYIVFIMLFTIENPDVKMMQQLELAKDHAEKANRAKSDFLSSMSHEIRTPLNAIVGFSEMIETEESIEACKEDAKDIVLASHTLLEIVNGILDISKIEANKMEIVNKEYRLLPELENLAKLMVPRIGDKDLKLISNFAPDIPSVLYGDIGKIKEVITNLLTNAVKYTDSGTINFNVSCINEKEYSSFVISVEDTGRGIKADHIDKLFTKFQRLEEDKNTTIEGTGLGLAITKNLVEMMGGKIVVQSEYGKGSIFTVYLKQKIVKLHDGVSGEAVSSEEKLDFSGKKVLVVDDNGLNIKLAKRLLANYNIDIDTAESGFECIDKVKENKYDLILLDDMMPKMRGTETLVKLKEDSSFNTPVVALTANSLSGMREVYLNAGFIDYLAKPIEKNELNKVFTKYLINNKDYSDKKILIVDDNKINIKIASKILSTFKFQIDEALSGQECIDKVKENKYDIIFMDYMMPGMDGIETFNKLKENEGFNTPVVALTADVVDNAKEKFIKEGFSDYISKPIDKDYLKEVVEKIIK